MRVERSISISASPERAFARVADWRSHGDWQPTAESIEAPETIALGSEIVEVRSAFGTRLTFDAEIVEFQPPSIIALHGRSRGKLAFDVRETFLVTPEGDGVKVAMSADGEVPMLFRPMQAGIALEVERQIEAGLKRLKELLETGQ